MSDRLKGPWVAVGVSLGSHQEPFGHSIEGNEGSIVLDKDVMRGRLCDLGPRDLACVAASLSSDLSMLGIDMDDKQSRTKKPLSL